MKMLRLFVYGVIIVMILVLSNTSVKGYELEKGERLSYSAKFLHIIPVGDASIGVKGTVDFDGNKLYLVTCEAKTAKWISLLFKAEGALNSYISADNLYPYKFEQMLRVAGKPDDIRRATYDRIANIMEAEGKGKKKVPVDVRDPISALYFLRNQEFKEGLEIKQTINNNQSNYIFDTTVTGRKKIGKADCWVLDSKVRRENKSAYNSTSITFYITDDLQHIPVLIKAMTKLGPVMLRLKQ
jgi:hypothetical protein